MSELAAMPKEEYKDSGVDWLGEIPSSWRLKRFKYLLSEINLRSKTGNETLLSLSKYFGVIPKDSLEERSGGAASLIGYKKVRINDLVINKMQAVNGILAISSRNGITSPDYSVYSVKNKEDLDIRFLGYLLTQPEYLGEFKRRVTGVMEGFIRLYTDDLYDIFSILPPINEQKTIANFLDQKTEQLDEAIAIKGKQIALLKERKQIIAQKAVTQGLNPDVPTKDSGVDWIGEIPEEWKVESFKNILVERNKKNVPIESRERLSLSIDKGITLYSEKTTNLDRFKDDFSQYKLTHKGDLVFNSMNMIVGAVGVSNYFGCVSPVYYTYYTRLENPKITKYYEYFFKSRIVQSQLYCLGKGIMAIDRGEGKFNTVRLKVSRDDLRSMKVPYPTISEITEIVDFIELESSKISKAIKLQEKQIEKLKEYKTTLINSAVTGRIKVPGVDEKQVA